MSEIKLTKVTPENNMGPMASSSPEDNVWYPHLHIDFDDLPVAADWENGMQYEIRAIVKQVSSSEKSADFEIRQIGGADTAQDPKAERYPRKGDSQDG